MLFIHRQGNLFSLHDPERLGKFLRIDNIGAFLYYLCFYRNPDAFFQIKGRQRAGVGNFCLYQNSLNGGEGGFSGDGTHQGGNGTADCGTVKNNFHHGTPFLKCRATFGFLFEKERNKINKLNNKY